MRWISRTALTITCLLGLLALGGAVHQSMATRMDARRSPEPGTLVDIGGYNLKIYCESWQIEYIPGRFELCTGPHSGNTSPKAAL
jgi:hypothetical protein